MRLGFKAMTMYTEDQGSFLRYLAVIPARGGSKRLKRKNILPFMDKPMMTHTIASAGQSGLFKRVLVSTEDAEISMIALEYGAEVVMRPHSLAGDSARVVDVCAHVLESESLSGRYYDIMVCLYATAPLRRAEDIRAVSAMIEPGVCDFAMAITRFRQPPHQALKMDHKGFLAPMWPDLVDLKSQEVPEMFVDNGSTYAVTVKAFLEHMTFYGPNLRGHEMPFHNSVDIDTSEDLTLAQYFALRKQGL